MLQGAARLAVAPAERTRCHEWSGKADTLEKAREMTVSLYCRKLAPQRHDGVIASAQTCQFRRAIQNVQSSDSSCKRTQLETQGVVQRITPCRDDWAGVCYHRGALARDGYSCRLGG